MTKAKWREQEQTEYDRWCRMHDADWRHSSDAPVSVVLHNTAPHVNEHDIMGVFDGKSVYAWRKALQTQGYRVGKPVKVGDVYVIPYCPTLCESDFAGIDWDMRRAVYDGRLLLTHEVAVQVVSTLEARKKVTVHSSKPNLSTPRPQQERPVHTNMADAFRNAGR